MTISIIRQITKEDETRIERAAGRFIKRHEIKFHDFFGRAGEQIRARYWCVDYWCAINHWCESAGRSKDERYRRYLWQKCLCRAVKEKYDSQTNWSWCNHELYVGSVTSLGLKMYDLDYDQNGNKTFRDRSRDCLRKRGFNHDLAAY